MITYQVQEWSKSVIVKTTRCHVFSHREYRKSGRKEEGARTSVRPFFRSAGPRIDPEQVSLSSSPHVFPSTDIRVKLTSTRLSILLGALYSVRNWFGFPYIQGLTGHLRGDKRGVGHTSWPLLEHALLASGQYAILSRDRRFRSTSFQNYSYGLQSR